MRTTSSVRLLAATSASLILAIASTAGTAGAQKPDARWTPWLGCWTSGAAASSGATGGMVCVEPAPSGPGVDVATIANGVVAHVEHMNATGVRTPRTMETCPGWEMATWSADGRRLLLRSEYTCDKTTTVKGSGVFSIGQDGEWVQVQGSTVGQNAGAYVVRYRPAGVELAGVSGVQLRDSMKVRAVPSATGFAAKYARSAAGDPVTLDAVLEVARHVETPVASAWVNKLDQRFHVNGRELVRLADAGMPPSLIDQMVAMSYPTQFAVKRNEGGGAAPGTSLGPYGSRGGMGITGRYGSRWDCGYGDAMLAWGYYGDSCYPGYAYVAYGYSPYGYSLYGYNTYGYGYGGYGGNGYYFGQQPIIIIPRNEANQGARGQAVNGAGYTRRGSTPSTSGSGSGSSVRGSTSGSSSSGSSSSGTTSSGSSSGTSSTTPRTAKPRIPPG